jgi:hypothetical protein
MCGEGPISSLAVPGAKNNICLVYEWKNFPLNSKLYRKPKQLNTLKGLRKDAL